LNPKRSGVNLDVDMRADHDLSRSEPCRHYISNAVNAGFATAQLQEGTVGVSATSILSVVDDDTSVREALNSLLTSVGYRVEAFASAEDFLQSGDPQHTACLILDIQMPGMSGLELQHQMATANWRIPILFVTAHDDEAVRRGALQTGVAGCLRKPFSEEALLAAVCSAFEAGRGGAPRSSSPRRAAASSPPEMACAGS
jgi:FixJ family two-component response regulator